jgi:hypothetical protein
MNPLNIILTILAVIGTALFLLVLFDENLKQKK